MCYFEGHIRELGAVNKNKLDRLTKRIKAIPAEVWASEDENKPNKFGCFTTTQHIILRFPLDLEDHTKSKYYPLWTDFSSTILPLIKEVTAPYGYKKGKTARIILAKLYPGTDISMHTDANASANVPHKIHIPVQSNPNVRFMEEESHYYLEPGYAYEVNNKILHGVSNQSALERIHLIFDYYEAA